MRNAEIDVAEFSINFTRWMFETHPKIFNNLLDAYTGRKEEEE
tara:strand:+ start:324 stop:452 length:129 start_codon:yes stop_codon:yes gene_type:complete